MTKVIKADGSEEEFNASKIVKSIEKSCRDAKVEEEKIKKIITKVSKSLISKFQKKVVVRTSDIAKEVLSQLEKMEKAAVDSWRQFDKTRGK